tara:strand:+ start:204 stop:662 length:459 start_codon:yes stop_codon:yes gene_type:complete
MLLAYSFTLAASAASYLATIEAASFLHESVGPVSAESSSSLFFLSPSLASSFFSASPPSFFSASPPSFLASPSAPSFLASESSFFSTGSLSPSSTGAASLAGAYSFLSGAPPSSAAGLAGASVFASESAAGASLSSSLACWSNPISTKSISS